MKQLLGLLVFDAKAHRKYLLSTFAIMALLPVVLRMGLGHMNVFVTLAISFGIIVGLPFTFVGQERLKGTMGFIVGLPFSRTEIVLIKAGECALWSIALVAATVLPSLWLSAAKTSDLITLAVFEPAVIVLASCMLTSAYFLFSAQAVARGFSLLLFALTIFTARLQITRHDITFAVPELLVGVYVAALAIAGVSLYLAIRIWGSRASFRG